MYMLIRRTTNTVLVNNTDEPQQTTIYRGDGSSFELALEPNQIIWYEIA